MIISLILDIKPYHEKTYSCFEDVVATIAIWWNREYILKFIESWGFSYMLSPEKLECRIRPKVGNAYWALEEYHGISITELIPRTFDEQIHVINEEIKSNNPVSIYINSFWCPWNPAFQKYCIPHFCIVIGINQEEKQLICLDPFLTDKIKYLPYECLKEGNGKFMIFRLTNKKEINRNWNSIAIHVAKYALGINNNFNIFYAMREFAKEIESTFDITTEIKSFESDLEQVPLFTILSHVVWARMNLSKTIKHLATSCKVDKLLSISDGIEQAANQWSVVRGLFIKAHITGKQNIINKCISERIKSVADYEEELAYNLLNLSSIR